MKVLLLFISIILFSSPNAAHAEIAGKWEVFEIDLTTTNTYANPYIDVWLKATFTGPKNTKMILNGFWDGGNNWKIRFAPTKAGKWNYIINSNDAIFNGKKGSLEVIESDKKGFIMRDYSHTFAFKRSNGEHLFLMGDTCWNCMSNRNGSLDFSVFKEYINVRSKQKFNFIRSYTVPFYPDPDNSAHYNEGGRAFEPWDPDKINPKFFQEVDKRIAYANSRGITMNLVVGGATTQMTDFFGWGNGKMERYIRYIAARYNTYDIAWEGRAEFEEQKAVPPGAVNLANSIGNWLRKYDPYGHIISMHTVDSNNELAKQTWLDWIMHSSQNWTLITQDRRYNKPVMNEEFLYENSGAGSTHDHMVDAEKVRKGAWMLMIHGATGFAYGNTGTLNSRLIPFSGLKYSESPGADYMTYLNDFWIRTEYWKLIPDNRIVKEDTAFVVVDPGSEYVLYLPDGGSTTVDLSAASGTLSVGWYNPRAGTYQGQTTVEGGASRTFTAPDSNDWVLHIKAVDGTLLAYSTDNITVTTAPAHVPFSRYLLERLHLLLNALKRFISSI